MCRRVICLRIAVPAVLKTWRFAPRIRLISLEKQKHGTHSGGHFPSHPMIRHNGRAIRHFLCMKCTR